MIASLNKLLVIDEVPVIAFGLQETFSPVNPFVRATYLENVFIALSSKQYDNTSFDLVVLGIIPDGFSENMRSIIRDLKRRFNNPRIMIYANSYNHLIIEKMEQLGIDAYVHKYETMEEVQKAYTRVSAGDTYISEIYTTLYSGYHLNLDLFQPSKDFISLTGSQKDILLLLCEGKSREEISALLHLPLSEIISQVKQFSLCLGVGV